MIKKIIVAILAVIIVIFLFISGTFSFIDDWLTPPVDRSCQVDSDCTAKIISCGCGCPIPVNVNWEKSCSFSFGKKLMQCEPCPKPRVECVNNICVRKE